MENKRYVLDANIFLEYIFARPLQDKAKQIIRDAVSGQIQILLPCLLLDEITEVLCGNLDNIDQIQLHLRYIEKLVKEEIIYIVVPDIDVRLRAIEIARTGHRKSGFPELTDCLYHALAILNDAVFITNDKKHISKVKKIGQIQKLSNYGAKGTE